MKHSIYGKYFAGTQQTVLQWLVLVVAVLQIVSLIVQLGKYLMFGAPLPDLALVVATGVTLSTLLITVQQTSIAADEHVVSRAEFFHNIYQHMFEIDKMLMEHPDLLRVASQVKLEFIQFSAKSGDRDAAPAQPFTLFTESDESHLPDNLIRLKGLIWYMINFFDELFMMFEPRDGSGRKPHELRALKDLALQFEWEGWRAYIRERMSSPVFLEVFCEMEHAFGASFVKFVQEGQHYAHAKQCMTASNNSDLRRMRL